MKQLHQKTKSTTQTTEKKRNHHMPISETTDTKAKLKSLKQTIRNLDAASKKHQTPKHHPNNRNEREKTC
jgi:hypothetical protein